MRKCFFFLIILASVLTVSTLHAEPWTADKVKMVHLEDERRYVCNPDGVLSQNTVDSIDALLYHLENTKGVQTVVVAVKHVKDGDCYQFGIDLGRLHGVGSKEQQTGLVIVLSTYDRSYYILTGYGLEGSLPDAICSRIEHRYMVPRFKQSDWDGGMQEGVKAICNYLQGDDTLKKELDKKEDDNGTAVLALLFIVIMIFIIIMVLPGPKVCPKCGKKRYYKVSQKFLYTKGNWDYYQITMRCNSCHYTQQTIERHKHQDHDDNDALLTGIFLGSMAGGRGGGFGGSGFSGGSFGGGGFGGGGAGGKF